MQWSKICSCELCTMCCSSELGEIGDTWLLSSFCATDFRTMMMLLTALLLWTLVSTNWTLHVCFPILLYVFSLFFIWNGIVCKEKWILLNCGTLFRLTTLCRIICTLIYQIQFKPASALRRIVPLQKSLNAEGSQQLHIYVLWHCFGYMYQLCFVFIIWGLIYATQR